MTQSPQQPSTKARSKTSTVSTTEAETESRLIDHQDEALATVFLPATQEFNVRMLAYITFAATFAVGVLTDLFAPIWSVAAATLVIYPLLIHFLTRPLRRRYPTPVRQIIITMDALVYGAAIVALGLTPLISLLLLILTGASFIIVGRVTVISTAILALIAGGAVTYHYYPEWLTHTPNEAMVLTTASFSGLYVLVSAYYMVLLARNLLTTRKELQSQSTTHKDLSLKLSKYIAPQVWQTIFSGHKDVRLESTRKRLVVFFSDLQGFTQLSDKLEPETLTVIINQYFEEMAHIALKHGGTIDKFIGDSIMVFFGDPESMGTQKDAVACVTMALAMRRKMAELKRKWRKELGIETELNIRMGINTGFCTVGNFGSETRMDYTIMGKEVNLASRLESSAGPNEILISKTTHELVNQGISSRHKGDVRAKGFAEPVAVFEVVGLRRELGEQSLFTDVDLSGFSMQFDMDRLKTYDKERILTALAKAHSHIKKGLH